MVNTIMVKLLVIERINKWMGKQKHMNIKYNQTVFNIRYIMRTIMYGDIGG